MTTTAQLTELNHYRQMIHISRYVESKLLHNLVTKGYAGLKMQYAATLTTIAIEPIRLNDLANKLGMSKQQCNQSLKPIKALGLLQQEADANDGRAKLITLSKLGKALIIDAAQELDNINKSFANILDEQSLKSTTDNFNKLAQHFNLVAIHNQAVLLPATIDLIAQYCEKRLMEITKTLGFDDLQISYGQVLRFFIDPKQNINISLLAQENHISAQAISKTVSELEARDYLCKKISSDDKRSKQLILTDKGQQLLKASTEAGLKLNQELIKIIGKNAFEEIQNSLKKLFRLTKQELTSTQKLNALKTYIEHMAQHKEHDESEQLLSHILDDSDIAQLNGLLQKLFIQT